jgi:hypothetical protein
VRSVLRGRTDFGQAGDGAAENLEHNWPERIAEPGRPARHARAPGSDPMGHVHSNGGQRERDRGGNLGCLALRAARTNAFVGDVSTP